MSKANRARKAAKHEQAQTESEATGGSEPETTEASPEVTTEEAVADNGEEA